MQSDVTTPTQTIDATPNAAERSFNGEDEVEIFPVEDQPFVMSELLSAFAELWQ